MAWLRSLRFEEFAAQATTIDYLAEVDHASERIERLERAIDDAVASTPKDSQEADCGSPSDARDCKNYCRDDCG